jgi:transcription initiation factor TFIIIB Brf1 subunit/transcription initiation factor TFIIB
MPGMPGEVVERAYDLYLRWTEVRPDTSVTHSLAETRRIACLFRAAREHGMDPSLSAMGTRGAWSPVFRAYNMLRRDLDLPIILAKPENIIKDITSNLQSSPDVLELALDIAHAAKKIGMLNSMTARVTAAVSVHLASIKVNEPLARKEVASAAGISEGALHVGIISFRTRAEREMMHNGPNVKAARLLI